jgi:hypothetical protein
MIVDFKTKDLQEAMKGIRRIFDKGPLSDKSNNQGCLVASKEDDTVVVESASQGLYVRVKLDASVEESGKVVVNRDYFSNLKLMGANAVIKYDDGQSDMRIKSGSFDGTINASQESKDVEDQRPISTPKITASVPCDILRVGLKRLMFAVTTCDKHRFLKARIQVRGNKLVLSANDSYRAALFTAVLENEAEETLSLVLPASFISAVVSTIATGHVISFGVNDSMIRVVGGHVDVCHPVVEDEGVADIEAVVKGLNTCEPVADCSFNVSQMRDAVVGASSVVPSSMGVDPDIGLRIKESGQAVVSVATTVGSANCKFEVSDVTVTTEDTFNVSAKYLVEMLGMLGDGDAVARFWDGQIMLRSETLGVSLILPLLSDAE